MNVLDSPLEALALNYFSYGFLTVVNNLWAWIAVIAAAFSFWRIRAVASTSALLQSDQPSVPRDRNSGGSQPRVLSSSSDHLTEGPVSASVAASSAPARASITSSVCAVEADGVTKGRFTVYYRNDRESDAEYWPSVGGTWNEGVLGSPDVVDSFGVGGEWCEFWERVLKTRRGEMGWHRFQDLTVLNGSVVRLWDGSRRESCFSSYSSPQFS